jgi:hypothetical protein
MSSDVPPPATGTTEADAPTPQEFLRNRVVELFGAVCAAPDDAEIAAAADAALRNLDVHLRDHSA